MKYNIRQKEEKLQR
jgi:hypothetical protein